MNIIHVMHRDEVESPLVDWLKEAYDLQDQPTVRVAKSSERQKSTVTLTARRSR